MPDQLDLFTYTSYRLFLRDWLEWHKGRPSLRTLAKRIGMSPSMLSQVIGGSRDLPPTKIGVLTAELGLDERGTGYFRALVELADDPALPRRQAAWDLIEKEQRIRQTRHVAEATYRLLSRWYLPAITELARCEGWRADPAWIARTLVPAITEQEAADALALLLELGALVRGEDGAIGGVQDWGTSPDVDRGVLSLAAANMHRWVLERGTRAIEEFGVKERHLGSFAIALPEEALPELKRRIADFERELMFGRHATDDRPKRRVLQIAVQVYPLSRRTDESE